MRSQGKEKSWVSEHLLPLLGLQSRICFGQVQWESSEGRDSAGQWVLPELGKHVFLPWGSLRCFGLFIHWLMRLLWMRGQQQRIYQHFGIVWFQNSTIYLNSFTIVVSEKIFYFYICYMLLNVSLLYCLCCSPDVYSHQSLCFQDSIIHCNTNINSFLVKKCSNPCYFFVLRLSNIAGNFPMISDDLVNSYHLLLCALDLVYGNALQCPNRKELLNPNFKGMLKKKSWFEIHEN